MSRFILSSNHFASGAGHVRKRAFEPARDHATSVFEILARGDIIVDHVRRVGLEVERSEPPPRHSNIVDWPPEKHEVMSLCERLAAKATLVRPMQL
jgi:hypothetical protein